MGEGEGMSVGYSSFLATKQIHEELHGFKPLWMPDWLFGFQSELTDWAIRTGRVLLAEDCGMGKTPQELVWAKNIVMKTRGNVLILAPLAVSHQFVREGKKFEIPVHHAGDGVVRNGINVVNYERLRHFRPGDFVGLVCDESSILKHHNAQTRRNVSEFAAKLPYLLLATATPAPNDFMELGNSAEVLRVMKYQQMLAMYFVNDGETSSQWRLRGHAKKKFWHWVSTWARAVRKPSDLGYDDDGFVLPPLKMKQYMVPSPPPVVGFLPMLARTLGEQRQERRNTIHPRCEQVASLVSSDRPFIAWCHLNAEGDLLEELLPDAVQVAGCDDDQVKEDRLDRFSRGEIRVLVSKPRIAGFGLNWQHCSDVSFFPSHSWEQWYQAVRRCYRFGQSKTVTVNIVTSEAESLVLSNMKRKEKQAVEMYDGIVREMGEFQHHAEDGNYRATVEMGVPKWLR